MILLSFISSVKIKAAWNGQAAFDTRIISLNVVGFCITAAYSPIFASCSFLRSRTFILLRLLNTVFFLVPVLISIVCSNLIFLNNIEEIKFPWRF
jgi:hypothetical protein